MKRFFICMMIIAVICTLIPIHAAAYSNSSYEYAVLYDNTVMIISYHGYYTDVNIPSHLYADGRELPVSTIGQWAFQNCDHIKSVVIPDTVTTIRQGAFRGCTNLTSITVPDSVTYIGRSAFYDTDLQNLPEDEDFVYIGKVAYYYKGDYNYADVTFKDGTLGIAGGIFYVSKFAGPRSVVIPDSVKTIGDWAFRGCSVLENVQMGNGVERIEEAAFANCGSLTRIVLPSSTRYLYADSFEGCINLTLYSKEPAIQNYAETHGIPFVLLSDDDPDVMLGDVDNDGVVSVLDATRIQKYKASIIKENEIILSAADVDGDGFVTVMDATRIQKFKAQIMNLDGSTPYVG